MDAVCLQAAFGEFLCEGDGEEDVGGFGLSVGDPFVIGSAVLIFVKKKGLDDDIQKLHDKETGIWRGGKHLHQS